MLNKLDAVAITEKAIEQAEKDHLREMAQLREDVAKVVADGKVVVAA